MITSADHVRIVKQQALAFLPKSPVDAVICMMDGLTRHSDTYWLVTTLTMVALRATQNADTARQFIEGFKEV